VRPVRHERNSARCLSAPAPAPAALTAAYTSMNLPLMTVELPRSAMGVMMPSGA